MLFCSNILNLQNHFLMDFILFIDAIAITKVKFFKRKTMVSFLFNIKVSKHDNIIESMGSWLYTNIISSCLHTRIDNHSYTLPRMSVMLNNYDHNYLTLRQTQQATTQNSTMKSFFFQFKYIQQRQYNKIESQNHQNI